MADVWMKTLDLGDGIKKNILPEVGLPGMVWEEEYLPRGLEKGFELQYFNNLLVLSTYYSGLWYSTDGITWTQSNITSGTFSIMCSDTLLVGLSTTGQIVITSTDGKNWTSAPVGFEANKYMGGDSRAINFNPNNNIWIAGSDNAGLWYSEDYMLWEQTGVTSGTINDIETIDDGGNIYFFAGDDSGNIYISGNGFAWSNYSGVQQQSINFIRTDNFDERGTGQILIGTSVGIHKLDGDEAIMSNIPADVYNDAKCANELWVAASSHYGLLYSYNGLNWTQSNVTSGAFYTVHYANGLWVAGGSNGLYYSTDGMTWTQSNITDRLNGPLYYFNGMWVNPGLLCFYSKNPNENQILKVVNGEWAWADA